MTSDWVSPLQHRLEREPMLAGRYRILAGLGRGGMGVVLKAEHLMLRQKVAIKLLLPGGRNDSATIERFLREARAAAQIKGEHAAKVLDVGSLSTGEPFMVMEFLEGRDLSEELHQRGTLQIGEVVEYVLQACEALAEAHSLGLVHRDLKPANLFLTHRADGSPLIKVLDFGISKQLSEEPGNPKLTGTTVALGTPLYMAPEQLRSARDVDEQADIWSLGVVLYELLSGQVPFDGDSLPALTIAIISDEPKPLPQVRPEIPAGLWKVVSRALKKEKEERYKSVSELTQALAPFAPERARLSVDRAAGIAGIADTRLAPTPGAAPKNSDIEKPRSAPDTKELSSAPKASTQPDSTITLHGPPERSSWRWLAGAGFLLLAGGGLFLYRTTAFQASAAPPVAPSASEATPSPPASASTSESASPAGSTVNNAPAASSVAATKGPEGKPPTFTNKVSSKAPRKADKPANRPNCNPDYTLVDGIKRMKPECL